MSFGARAAFAFARTGGFVLAHGSEQATTFARFRGPTSLAPDASGCLGGLGLHGERPAIADARGRMALAFIEDGKPRLYVDKAGLLALDRPAHAVALAYDGRKVLLVGSDAEGVWAARILPGSPFEVKELGHLVRRGDVRGALEAHRLGDGHLVFYGLRDAALGVLRIGGDGRTRDVRYRIDAPCVHLATAPGARQIAVALAYDGEHVERALFDAEGRAIERPHLAFRSPGARFVSAQAVWTGRRFAAGGLDATDGACTLQNDDALVRLPGFRPGPLALFHLRDRYVGFQVEREGRGLGVAIRTLGPDGSGGEGGVRAFEPEGAAERERRARAVTLLRALRAELERGSYRDGGSLALDEDTLRLALGSGERAPALGLVPREGAIDLELVLSGDAASGGGTLGARVARFFADVFRDRARLEAWARDLAEGVVAFADVRAHRRRDGHVLRFALLEAPRTEALAALVERIRTRRAPPR